MKRLVCLSVALSFVTGLSLCATAQVKKGKTRPLTTKQMMSGWVKPNCAAIGEALKTPPTDEKGWEDLATKAAVLNESGYALMEDGRCPDADWANASKALREATAAVLEKIAAKDGPGASEAFKGVTGSCGACHKVHKK